MSKKVDVKPFPSAPQFLGIDNTEKDFICYVCFRPFSRVGFLKAHFQRTHPKSPFPDTLSNKLTPSAPKVTLVRKVNMFTKKTEETTYTCEQCKKSFEKKIELLKHAFVHRRYPLTYITNPIHATKQVICKDCNGHFFGMKRFLDHSEKCALCTQFTCKIKTGEIELCKTGAECRICQIPLCKKCHALHRELEVVEEKSFECVVCQQVFPSKMEVKDHYANDHGINKLAY